MVLRTFLGPTVYDILMAMQLQQSCVCLMLVVIAKIAKKNQITNSE